MNAEVMCPSCKGYFNPKVRINIAQNQRIEMDCPTCGDRVRYVVNKVAETKATETTPQKNNAGLKPLSENATFVERVVRFLGLLSGCFVCEHTEYPGGDFTITILHRTITSEIGVLRNDMPVDLANAWCHNILGRNLGDVWNCDRAREIDPDVEAEIDDNRLVACPHGSGLCVPCPHVNAHQRNHECAIPVCKEILQGYALYPRRACEPVDVDDDTPGRNANEDPR